MPRGGKRTPKEGNKLGRPKEVRPVDGNLARKIKAQIKAEEKWLRIIELENNLMEVTGKTGPLKQSLIYLDDRDLGRPLVPVNHLHDKPIEHVVSVTFFEAIERARKRAEAK
jgi:hypothetical protein